MKRKTLPMRPPSLPLILCCLAALASRVTAGTKILVIGDSLTKEYQITFPGVPLVGVPGIDMDHPAARNWVEILSARRGDHFDQGVFKPSVFAPWKDLRVLGHEYNWAVPGATARQVRDLVTGQNREELTEDGDFSQITALAPEWEQTAARLAAQLPAGAAAAGGVVILLGGNDLRFGNPDPSASVEGARVTYGTIYSGDGTGAGNPQPLMDSIKSSIQQIVNFVRAGNPTIPLAVCAVPHVGATPVVRDEFPTDPARTGRVTAAVEALNAELKTWTETTAGGVWIDGPYTATKALLTASLDIGGITFQNTADPLAAADSAAAHNRYLFAQDGFHPTTALHALISREVSDKLRAKHPAVYGAVAPLTTAEIVVNVLGLTVTTGFTEFLTASGVPENARGALDDPDGDSLANLTEFALAGLSPNAADPGVALAASLDESGPAPAAVMTWTPRYADNVACVIACQASPDLTAWTDVPDAQITTAAVGGARTASVPVPAGGRVFLRLKVSSLP